MKARISFTSSHFPVEPGEDEDINPGIYGKALAQYLASKLKERGVEVEGIVEEDFARLVMLHRRPFRLWVACANDEGSTTNWQLFLSAEIGLVGWLRRQSVEPAFSALREHVRAIVEAVPAVSQIQWHAQ
jgi:hypothetical protein